jgi:hypothetical protein
MSSELDVGLIDSPKKEFQALSNAEKQVMYEAMAIQGLLSLMGYKSATAEGDKEMIQRFCQDAKQNLEALFWCPSGTSAVHT